MSASQEPRLHVAPRAARTFGDLAADLAADYGLSPDPWQQIVLDDWLAVDKAGRWCALSCGLSVPRQNGKNALIEVRELFGMVGRGEKILHTAHEVKTARKAFKRLQHFFGTQVNDPAAKYPELNALVSEVRNVNGQEAIVLANGGSVEVVARSKNSGRGFTVDVLVMDEAQEMGDDDLEALMPTTSAAPLGNPQWIFTGTPPGPRASGEVFTRTRTDALDRGKRACWHEWSAESDMDLDDHAAWRAANPALVTGRLQLEVVEGERGKFSDDGFARERLGMWSQGRSAAVIDSESWGIVADEASVALDRLALAVDVSPDRSTASVAVAGQRADGRWHVELDENRRGTGWLAGWVEARCERADVRAVVIDSMSAAAALIDELAQRKIKVTTTNSRDMAAACANFYDGVMDARVHHIDQPQLSYAVSVARKRPIGDAWGWNRKDGDSDITPLVAATLALWGAQNSNVKKPTRKRTGGRRVVVA